MSEPFAPPRNPRFKRVIIGNKLPDSQGDHQLLRKRFALPIFASDPLSSVAYAPQELLSILLIGGTAFLTLAPWVAACVVLLLIVVVASYRQLIRAYPSGGGDYEVASRNLGKNAGLVVASALLIDYVLTVAVSVASGVDNIISAVPGLAPWRVEISLVCVVILAAINLRGVSEASKAFAAPTYLFVGSIALMVVVGLVRTMLGDAPVAESAGYDVQAEQLTQAGMVLLVCRAFSSGCSALTGVEAISNGVPAFRRPKVRNAQTTLTVMGGIAIVLFVGLTALALISGVHYAENACHLIGYANCETTPQRSLVAQVSSATFGNGSVLFYIIQAATALVLLLAANTAFNGFPLLGAVLAGDRFAPKGLRTKGDRLVFSNGVIALALVAGLLLLATQADLSHLIQLYIIGVFVSFSLGQLGMVRHWIRRLRNRRQSGRARATIMRFLAINALGAFMTMSVFVIVTITKFTHGAWVVFVLMPVLVALMTLIHRYYARVEREIAPDRAVEFGSAGDVGIVLVGALQKPVLKALDYARSANHQKLIALHVSVNKEDTKRLERQWCELGITTPLTIVESPYREIAPMVARVLMKRRAELGSEVATVYTPVYIVGHWWERLLHNQRSRNIRRTLLLVPGTEVVLVPWLLDSSGRLYEHRRAVMPGQVRSGLIRPSDDELAERSRIAGLEVRVTDGRAELQPQRGAEEASNTR